MGLIIEAAFNENKSYESNPNKLCYQNTILIFILNKEQLENLKSKEYFQSEGIIGRVFARLLKKRLSKDKNLQKAVDKMDKSSEDLKKSIQSAQKDGVKIPDELLVYAGLKKAR